MKKISISLKNISKAYFNEKKKTEVLDNVSIEFEEGKFYAIMGHSGSGKSTLISIIGLLESFGLGEYKINERDISRLIN